MHKPSYQDVKFACIMSLVTTFVITFTLVAVNLGFTDRFIFVWLRSWFIAFVIALVSILFLAPIVRKILDDRDKR